MTEKKVVTADSIVLTLNEVLKAKTKETLDTIQKFEEEDLSTVQLFDITFFAGIPIDLAIYSSTADDFERISDNLRSSFHHSFFELLNRGEVEGLNDKILKLYNHRLTQYASVDLVDEHVRNHLGRIFSENFDQESHWYGKEWRAPLIFSLGDIYMKTLVKTNDLLEKIFSEYEVI